MAKKTPSPTPPTAPPPAQGYTVLARRYRPQQFADLIGQEAIAQALGNALKSNRVAHAYLFTGARGVGKTSTARILAKALNCVHGPTVTPCDTCEPCLSIASGEDLDVLEIDGASNRGIDEVREIRGNVQYRPSRARYKIYIIDEVHMLTPAAFNALLKTLEEPPEHVKFIFATTEVQKIPVTILSRCQRFDFGSISPARIAEHLKQTVAGEQLQADDEALELIARRAAGSMRDAQSLLDQLLAFGGDRLSVDQVHQLLGTAGEERVLELAAAVLEHDPKRALELLSRAADEGLATGELVDQLLAYWRDLMILSCAGTEARDLSVSPRHRETLSRQASALSLDSILAGLDILAGTKARLRYSNHGRVLLEMALVRLGRLDDLVSLAQLAQWLGPNHQAGTAPRAPSGRLAAPPEAQKKKPVTTAETSTPLSLVEENLPQLWREVVAQVGPILGSQLEKISPPAISGPNALVLRIPASYTLLLDPRQQSAKVGRIEEALRKLTGQPCLLRVETVLDADEPPVPARAEEVSAPAARNRGNRAEALQDPLLQRAMEVLQAQVLQVDDGFGTSVPNPRPMADSDERPEE
jgi:DNA polymerase-3 subunit gamma/tau